MNQRIVRMAAGAAAALLTAAVLLAQTAGGFRFDGPLSRVITPNGDGINDAAVFCFDNPSDSDVSGTIYTLLGREVASLEAPKQVSGTSGASCPSTGSFNEQHSDWDPRAQGAVTSGVYVYQVRAEGRSFSGTLVVVW